jgi:hypothetical protein
MQSSRRHTGAFSSLFISDEGENYSPEGLKEVGSVI